jgi:filamentous hemagglutinin
VAAAVAGTILHLRFADEAIDVNRGGQAINKVVTWIDEPASMSPRARAYDAGAIGSRSNLVTRTSQAPAIELRNGGQSTIVRFDGEEAGYLIDRKLAVVTSPKARDQVLRQSRALQQNSLRGRWEVPNEAAASRARQLFQELGVTNIDVRIVPE